MQEILIVDDNPANLELLTRLLSNAGYKTRAATSGQRALQSSRLSAPDLVLLDISMPDLDGYEVCKLFKEDPAVRSVPILFISALDDPLDKVTAFSVGGEDYITKPFQPEEVVARVRHQLRIAGLKRDLEERNRHLERLSEELRRNDELKNQFLGIVAHDLRNPLGNLVLAAQLLQDEEDLEEIHSIAARMVREGMEMSQLINRFLEVAALEAGGVSTEPEAFELGKTVHLVVQRHSETAAGKSIALEEDLPASPVQAFADLKFVKEILDNLLTNALKFSPPRSSIRISAGQEGGAFVFAIQDQGPGLTEEDRKRLFGRFAVLSAKPTAGEKSTGLGLFIVKHMVDAMGGSIRAEDAPGGGTLFRVTIPRDPP